MTGIKNKKKKVGSGKIKQKLWLIVVGVVVLIGVVVLAVMLKDIPNPKKLVLDEYPESSQLYDRNGKLLFEFYGDKRRIKTSIDKLPDSLVEATISIEDANFYNHNGFDWRGILRGLYRTIVEKRLQGGSTLTQQLVKNGLLTQERTVTRKIKEAVLTVITELMYSKKEILEMYFNQTPYGGTIWGVGAAARGIFNKNVADLDLAESALIAGLPGSPTRYNPFYHADLAKQRQGQVLSRMLDLGYISKEEHDKAEAEQLNYYVSKNNIVAPHFVFYVKEKLVEKYGEKLVNEGGLKITTSLDSEMQQFAELAIASETGKLKKYNVTNGAALIVEPKTGQILSMVGSKDYWANDIDGKFNVTTANRQPGSSIKPLNYAVAIETGKITAASIFDDRPTCFKVENQKPYCPTNYGGAYHGIQTTRNSLANSLNIPAVKVLKLNGLETFVASASAMGLSTLDNASDYGLSLTLGGGEVTMENMVEAYGVLANMGTKQKLESILKVEDRKGKVIDEYQSIPGERVISKEASFIVGNILSDDGARSMVFGAGSLLNIKKHPEVSVKTGTTNDLRDNWTIGYTSDFVTAVWVGNNDNSKMSGVVSGTTGAAPIWNKVMTYLLRDKQVKKPALPQDVISLSVCNLTGQLPPDSGCDSHNEYFIKEYLPTKRVDINQNILIDKDTGRIVVEGDNKPNVEWQVHPAVTDATGITVCLDCPPPGDADKKSATIN
ncbi:transglycosylase domain-containing protein [Candidatus Shapirobacteria bacterium]|nr:transglycosylase domain-containing protein [Candidatus Shapirobacteria bacterium]